MSWGGMHAEHVTHHPESPISDPAALAAYPILETHLLRSEAIKQTFQIQVQRPCLKAGQAQRLPVVYATDANYFFDLLRNLSLCLHIGGEAPPFLLVGIGYPSNSPFAGMTLRCRDLTFPPYPVFDPKVIPDVGEGQLVPEDGSKHLFGGEDFRQFIKEDLIPFIDAHYATASEDRTYFGHSGGGYFGLFSLFTDSSLFKNYICSSPGLLMHGTLPGGFEHNHYDCGGPLVRDFLASGQSLDNKLYMSVGEDEEIDGSMGSWKMVSGFCDMRKLLRSAKITGLNIMSEILPSESHYTAIPMAFTHGIQAVFGTRPIVHSIR